MTGLWKNSQVCAVPFEITAECPVTGAVVLHMQAGVLVAPVFMPACTQATVKGLTVLVLTAWSSILLTQACLNAQTRTLSPTPPATARLDTQPSYTGEFNPERQKPLRAESSAWAISLVSSGPPEVHGAARTFLFRVKRKPTGAQSEFRISNETAQVDEIHVVHESRVVVIGRILANTCIINLIDLSTGALLDSIWCFRPAVSPDRRLVAYVKVYPAHFVQGESAQYLLYDLTATPAANKTDPHRTSDHINVGLPIFPEGSANAPGDNTGVAEEHRHWMASVGFSWVDNTTLAFADGHRGMNRLVVVSLANGIRRPQVSVTPIDAQDVVDLSKCPDYTHKPEHAFSVIDIRVPEDKEGYLTLQFRSLGYCLRRSSMDIRIR